MQFFSPPKLLKLLTPAHVVWEIKTTEKKLFVTFDDGPNPSITPAVLDILDEYDARATFFCVGEKVAANPDLYKEILARGHAVGNHTYSHVNGWHISTAEYLENITACDRVVKSGLFRPPYGKITPWQLRALKKHYTIIMWSLMSYDFDPRVKKGERVSEMIRKTAPGSVVVFHDSPGAAKVCLDILPGYLDFFSRKGYAFEPIQHNHLQ